MFFKMFKLKKTHFIICVLIFSMWNESKAHLSQNYMKTQYIEDLCTHERTKINLAKVGKGSAVKIISRNRGLTKDFTGCNIKINSASKGVILTLNSTENFYFEQMGGHIQLMPKDSSEPEQQKFTHISKSIKLSFAKCCETEEKLAIIATSYRHDKPHTPGDTTKQLCSTTKKLFRCRTSHCISYEYFCDGTKNCPDGSDEGLPFTEFCSKYFESFSPKPLDVDWKHIPTSRSVQIKESFNLTIASGVTCAFIIFLFGLLRLVCHYQSIDRQIQRRSHAQRRLATANNSNGARQRPEFPPEFESPPPPYMSLLPNGNPPAYSTIVAADENEAKYVSGPPPPYEP